MYLYNIAKGRFVNTKGNMGRHRSQTLQLHNSVQDILPKDLLCEVQSNSSGIYSSSEAQQLTAKVLDGLIRHQLSLLKEHKHISCSPGEGVPHEGVRAEGAMQEITTALASGGWRSEGNILAYILEHPGEGIKLRLKLISQLGEAIKFLHKNNHIHGNVHPGDMLVDAGGKATLINFGVYTALQKIFPRVPLMECHWYKSRQENEMDEVTNPTKEMDMHAFAASIYVIFKGEVPYHVGNSSFPQMIFKGHLDLKLEKPLSMPQDLWIAVKACWAGGVPSHSIDLILKACCPTLH